MTYKLLQGEGHHQLKKVEAYKKGNIKYTHMHMFMYIYTNMYVYIAQ